MPYFYHYTDDEGAEMIIRTGKIMASLKFMAGDDAAYGNRVYLTKLKPKTSTKTEIAVNNWTKTSPQFMKKTKNYFVLDLPDKYVKEVKAAGRNIFLFGHGNDLSLLKFSWWLKDFDSSRIIASYKYTVSSQGPALAIYHERMKMGTFAMTEETVNGRPVYKSSKSNMYLFMDSKGNWCVTEQETDKDQGWLCQRSNFSLGPDSNHSWLYFDSTVDLFNPFWNEDDVTLMDYPWQI